ncbi:flagellin [Paracoccaceae bacterium]|nr:flagellin [Paracoccaceae bacterium]
MANIGATTAFYKVETSLTRANSEVSKSMERLATGRQNANAGDRSSYVAMADTFRLDFVGTKAGIKGASVTMGYLETGMRVLDSASALLSRLQELAVLGANDTNTTADHEAINLEAEAIADEFNRLMTTSTYKGRDVFNETAGSLYVAMGGRDQEMTFGIGAIDYSDMYVEEANTIAGAQVTQAKAFGRAAAQGLSNAADIPAGSSYVVTTALAGSSYTTAAVALADATDVVETSVGGADSANLTINRVGTSYQVDITDAGSNYLANDTIQVIGGGIGGADTTNDLLITVDEVDAGGAITRVSITSGTAAAFTGEANMYDDADAGAVLGENFPAATSSIFRGESANDLSPVTSGAMFDGDVLNVTTAITAAQMDATIRLKQVVTGDLAFVAGESYTIASLGGSDGVVDLLTNGGKFNFNDASVIGRAVSGIAHGDTLTVGQTFTVDVDASTAEMAHLNSLTQGITFRKVSDVANDIDGPNRDAEFNLAHLPSDAVFARAIGTGAETGRNGASGLEAEKTYIVRTAGTGPGDYSNDVGTKGGDIFAGASAVYRQNGGNTAITSGAITNNDVIVLSSAVAATNLGNDMILDEVNTGTTAFLAGHEYEIVSMGTSDGIVDVSAFNEDAGAIARASSDIADGATLIQGTKFTVDEDASVTELAFLNALSEGMTFRMSSDTLTKDIEAMQGLLNTARVQAGSQYAALESAVNYTTDLTAQYELGYNTVNDVNFSMETAHLAKNQILQQAATAMLAQANSGQQGLLQLIS